MTSTQMTPRLQLNNGIEMPALGLGVFQTSPEDTGGAVEAALAAGYRLIDTAAAYGNEREVGAGIRRSGVDRSEVFVTTKLWMSDYGYQRAIRAFDASLRRLGIDYVDLYVLHWPMPNDFEATIGAYKAVEKVLRDGRARAIGVCNHKPPHLDALISRSDVVPAVNQIELHPYFSQRETRDADSQRGIVTQSWSPIGGVNVYSAEDPQCANNVLTDPMIIGVANKHGKTPAQVVLRWHLQHGLCAIPKSARPQRIAENFDVFDFELAPDELEGIDALDTGKRGGADPDIVDRNFFPLVIDD
jgi:2,5-diketo-D-gluconate reductase A